ncbi:antibiotic biosynthesis monooxygenase [Cryobacterium sp. TMT1-2-2]|uniref:putative quinol monooxygenase n=1 Tax=Cryobacterium sp. TMT1-2-2 TaxID=1259233 RepID=UPI00106B312D|nr:antibiotic biosynthesis monooxygenase [Cryobacterium sp. TMT1-2-2]TFD11877.1 antibiotic biosynthesis monooxygenase [Cryobacterium sp. TMT1-2-2]
MESVRLTGQLLCDNLGEAAIVVQYLPVHLGLTRAENGCISFNVTPTHDPVVWQVDERFRDTASFHTHQQRVSSSEWGRATSGIERRYTITGI